MLIFKAPGAPGAFYSDFGRQISVASSEQFKNTYVEMSLKKRPQTVAVAKIGD